MRSKLEIHDGQLCIVENWHSDYETPQMVRLFWPTGIPAHKGEWYVGEEVEPSGHGNGSYIVISTKQFVNLKDGGTTTPIHRETQPIKPPSRGGKGWRWQWDRGNWRKTYS